MGLVSRAARIWEHVSGSQGLVFTEVTVQHPGGDVLSVRSTIKAQPAIPNDIAQRRRCWLCGVPLVRQGNECWQSHCIVNAGWPLGGQGKSCSMMSQVSMCYPQSVSEEKTVWRKACPKARLCDDIVCNVVAFTSLCWLSEYLGWILLCPFVD